MPRFKVMPKNTLFLWKKL